MLIATLTSLFLQGVLAYPNIPDSLKSQAQVTFGAGVPFLSDTDLQKALAANGVSAETTRAVLQVNGDAHLAALRAALFVVALVAAIALFFTRWIPAQPPGAPAVVPEDPQAGDPQGFQQ